MKVMVIVKSDKKSEAGKMPEEKRIEAMNKFNLDLSNAGIMVSAFGLLPSSEGKRIRFKGDKRVITDGPFSDPESLVAGFWIWDVRSIDEALDWAKRCPNPTGGEAELEIRPLMEEEEKTVSAEILARENIFRETIELAARWDD